MTVLFDEEVEKPKQDTWRKRINLKKYFIYYKTIAIIVGLSAFLSLVYVIYNKNLQPVYIGVQDTLVQENFETVKTVETVETVKAPEYVCNSAECIHTASRVLKYMDKNKDPCENFYDFACGNFAEDTSVPNINQTESSSLLEYVVETQLKKITERPIQNDEPHSFQLIKKFYSACMDEERIEEEGLNTMKNILKTLGEWPVLHGASWVEDNFNWKDCDYSLKKLGYNSYLWNFIVVEKFENLTNTMVLDKPHFAITAESSPEKLESYFNYMVDIAVLFGADREAAKSELKESFELELEWSKIPLVSFKSYHRTTISQLETKYPSIPWLEYINNLVAPSQATENDTIIVPPEEFFTFFEAVVTRTPKRVQANYLMRKVIDDSIKYLTHDLRKRQSEYKSDEMEYDNIRWRECVQESKIRLIMASSAMYVNNYYNAKTKQTATQMVSDIKSGYKEILEKVDWIDETTRKYSLETLVSMTSNVGHRDELLDMETIEEYYKDLNLDNVDYLLSVLKINAFRTRLSKQKLRQRNDKFAWEKHIFAERYDAGYSMLWNNIQLPAGTLQGIFFNVDRPSYMNYASIGFIITRSMTEKFTWFKRYFDKHGNIVKESWNQNKTISGFFGKLRCLNKQYELFYPEPEQEFKIFDIDFTIYLEQVLAGNGGIEMAYLAYNKWTERNGLELKLPGLNYTPKQMFWISAANTLCSENRQTAKFSVFGTLRNSEYFKKDFNCPAESPMNPSEKCQLW